MDKHVNPKVLKQFATFLDEKLPEQIDIMARKLDEADLYSKVDFILETIPRKKRTYLRVLND